MVMAFAAGAACGAVIARALLAERASAHWERFWYDFWKTHNERR